MCKIRIVNITIVLVSLLVGMGWKTGYVAALTDTPTPSTTPTTTPTLTPTRANAASSGSLKFDENLPDLAIMDVRLVADMRYAKWCDMTGQRYLIVEVAASKQIPFFMLKVNQTEVLIDDYFYQPRWYWFSEDTIGEADEIQVVLDSQNDVAEMDEGNNAVTVRMSNLQAAFEAMPRCSATATATTTYTPGPSPTTTPGPSLTPTPT